MLQTTKTITISISFLFIFLLTSISIAQEVTLINQEFWRLSGGKGEWQLDPITGEKCLTVTGFGKEDDANYWTMPYTFLPNQTYRISCLVPNVARRNWRQHTYRIEFSQSGCLGIAELGAERIYLPNTGQDK